MLVSWDWLSQYVQLDMSADELAMRYALSGLNHESTQTVGQDTVIDLEVTSNRGDCLGHIGVAREAAVLYGLPLSLPDPQPSQTGKKCEDQFQVTNRFPEGCSRYTARIIRGVKIGPSPAWMVQRLQACGVKSINNVVDVTNYVMLECGQPLHAFDLQKLRGQQIEIRPARDREAFVAIDHRTYTLDPSMVVIADGEGAIALGGVMGGEQSEVTDTTVDLLIEAADFTPLHIRRAARSLRLHSPSSYRFERKVDPKGLDWASRRCCELILQFAGGELQVGMLETAAEPSDRHTVELRATEVQCVLGIEVPWNRSLEIMEQLGCECHEKANQAATIVTPSWRHDLTREIDLIEEIARIHGYDKIPEDVQVPITPSVKRSKDVLLDRIRLVAVASGLEEALTPSLVTKQLDTLPSMWTDRPSLATRTPLLEGANLLRRSLIPSLLQAKLFNQSQSNAEVHLFETAVIYLPGSDPTNADPKVSSPNALPREQVTLGMVSAVEPRAIRGIVDEMLLRATGLSNWSTSACESTLIADGTGLRWSHGEKVVAWMGQLHRSIKNGWKLDGELTMAEVDLDVLLGLLCHVPTLVPISPYPAVVRDLNLIVEESLQWDRLQQAIRQAAGGLLVGLEYRETYRDPKKDGAGKKRVLFGMSFQSPTQTLTGTQVDEAVGQVLLACEKDFSAKLLA